MEYKTIIKEYPNGINVIRIPILTPAQELERQKRIEKAAQGMLRDMAELGLLRDREEAEAVLQEKRKQQEAWLRTCTIITEKKAN